ncbi:unnamed protein product [Phytophthora lilii]|uniref:Unnamed protein product n=1 Tax=Phytophthora lilii TaxID=2077276 RepID=A0A9W6XA68_9STRA|nr:unnamed protein product [Phytophthora lilii]
MVLSFLNLLTIQDSPLFVTMNFAAILAVTTAALIASTTATACTSSQQTAAYKTLVSIPDDQQSGRSILLPYLPLPAIDRYDRRSRPQINNKAGRQVRPPKRYRQLQLGYQSCPLPPRGKFYKAAQVVIIAIYRTPIGTVSAAQIAAPERHIVPLFSKFAGGIVVESSLPAIVDPRRLHYTRSLDDRRPMHLSAGKLFLKLLTTSSPLSKARYEHPGPPRCPVAVSLATSKGPDPIN